MSDGEGTPAVSVVIPTHGEPLYLEEALTSVQEDDSASTEVIVVEDGTAFVNEGRLGSARLIRLPHSGRSVARNTGVAAASAPFVAFLDADDVSLPGRFGRQERVLVENSTAVLCFGAVDAIDERSRPLAELTATEHRRFKELVERGPTFEGLLIDCPVYPSASVVRRAAFLAVGGFEPGLEAYEDLELFLRLARHGELAPAPGGAVARHRKHRGNTRSEDLYRGSLRVTEKHLPGSSDNERRLLLERRVDSLWGLGEFRLSRRDATRAAVAQPRLLLRRRFLKRLVGSALPIRALSAIRARRS